MTCLVLLGFVTSVAAQLTPSPSYNPPPAESGTVPSVNTPNTQWSDVLGNSLWFYDAQRSGNLDQGTYGNRVSWRNTSGMEDGSDWGLDLTGGWYDAGDYIKCTYPLGFTMFALSWGALTHGKGYDLANQGAYLDGTLRWGYDWLVKAHPSDDVLFMQVGSTEIDNNYWGGDQTLATPRPSYPINSTSPGTDAWASTAAAFAMGALLYSSNTTYNSTSSSSPPTSPSLANDTYSSTLLSHAETLYKTAVNVTPYTGFGYSIPDIASAYNGSNYGAPLAEAALALALATNESSYYSDAYSHYQKYNLTGTTRPWTWDSRAPSLYVLFVETAIARPGLAEGAGLDANLTGWQAEAERYFDNIVNLNTSAVFLTKGGMLYWSDGESDLNSLQCVTATVTLLLKYAPMASSQTKSASYIAFAQSQINYIMGDNPMNAVYVVGSHPNSPKNPSSAPASGGSGLQNLRTNPPENLHVLYGGIVGGPLSNDLWWDWRDDWQQTEVALDYNANLPTIAAMQLINGTSDPFYVTLTDNYTIPNGQPCDVALPCRNGLSKGAIAGIVIGVVLGCLIIFGAIGYFFRRDIKACFGR